MLFRSIKDGGDSFMQLVKSCGGDVPYRAILDELIECGVVERVDGKGLRLKSVGRPYLRGSPEALQKAGEGLDGMMASLEKFFHLESRRKNG